MNLICFYPSFIYDTNLFCSRNKHFFLSIHNSSLISIVFVFFFWTQALSHTKHRIDWGMTRGVIGDIVSSYWYYRKDKAEKIVSLSQSFCQKFNENYETRDSNSSAALNLRHSIVTSYKKWVKGIVELWRLLEVN